MTRSRFEELEKRCKRFYQKQLLKRGLLLVGIGVISFGMVVVFKPSYLQEMLVPTPPLSSPLKEAEPMATQQSVQGVEESNETLVEDVASQEVLEPSVKESVLFLAPQFTPKHDVKLPQKEIEAANHLLHTERVLMNHFQKVSNYENAYALAQFYFEQKAYYEAIEWTKKANKLNPNRDATWLIYAKSKFALGEVEVAISALERIVGYIESKELRELLDFYKGQQ